MSYCSIEDAWGQNFNGSNPTRSNIGGIPGRLHNPELDEGVTFTKKYSNKNSHTRKIHSRRSRKQKVRPRKQEVGPLQVETRVDHDNLKYVDMQNDMPEYQNPSLQYENSTIPSAYSDMSQSMLLPLEAEQNEGALMDYMPPFEAVGNNVEAEMEEEVSNLNLKVEEVDEVVDEEEKRLKEREEPSEFKQTLSNVLMRLERLERKMKESSSNNIHDIVLFVLVGVFILFILDSIFKIGRMTI